MLQPILSSGEITADQMDIYILIAKGKIDSHGGRKGTIQCPACHGKLNFNISRMDSQSVGQCLTDHCVKWS